VHPDCTKLNNLKVAAKDMVDMIVQDVQTPYYTKMAIVPYSSSVNVGTYANSVRGTTTAAKTITGVDVADALTAPRPSPRSQRRTGGLYGRISRACCRR
jgi:hypothetical protein